MEEFLAASKEYIPSSVLTINSESLKVERGMKRERAPGGVYFKFNSRKQSGVPNRRWMMKSGRVPGGGENDRSVYFKLSGDRQPSVQISCEKGGSEGDPNQLSKSRVGV